MMITNTMQQDFTKEQNYIRAKKRVKEIKGFYIHLIVYVLINIFLSGIITYGLIKSGYTFKQAITSFGTYSTAFFWGIGMFFHWVGVFGFKSLGFGKKWQERKIRELMENDK